MTERILKDASNRIWMDSLGRVIKERPFSSQPLQNGLIADFDFNPNSVTLVNGRMSQVVATNNPALIWYQNNAAIQPKYGSDGYGSYLYNDTNTIWYVQNGVGIASLGVKNVCIVTEGVQAMFAGLDSHGYLGLPDNGYGGGSKFFYGHQTSPQSPFYHNGVKYNTTLTNTAGKHIFCGFGNITASAYALTDSGSYLMRVGAIGDKIRRVLLYGALSEQQAVYNMNALNVQYGVF